MKWLTEPYAGFSWEMVLHKYLKHLSLHFMLVKLKYSSFKEFIIHLSALMTNLFHILKYN